MSKYPVEIGDDEGTADAVNYLLSGPAGLGQNFAGFSGWTVAYLTGNFRTPFTYPTPVTLYVPPIALSTSEQLDYRTFKFTFAATQPSPPFINGTGVRVQGVTDPWYDDWYFQIGVIECTTDYCIVRYSSILSIIEPPSTGGTISCSATTGDFISTDCNGRATVTGGGDRVFCSGQLDNTISYSVISGPAELEYKVMINRYVGYPNQDPVNPEFQFVYDKTVAEKFYYASDLTVDGDLSLTETVFASVIDQPPPGYYWYILEVSFASISGTVEVTQSTLSLRSFSLQVVKQ